MDYNEASAAGRKARLKGGSYDGEAVWVRVNNGRRQPVLYLQKRISIADEKALRRDARIAWKPPEEVYELIEGEYVYKHTVYYKPIIGYQNE